MDDQLLIILAIGVPLLGTALVPLVGKGGREARAWFAVAMAFVTAAATVLLLWDVWVGRSVGIVDSLDWMPSVGLSFTVYLDPLAVMMALVAGCIGAIVVLYSVKYMEGSPGLSRYYALVLLFIGAMIGLVFVDSLLVLYFFWEIVGLCSYALIGFNQTDPKAARASIKAFVTTRVGDVAFLVGIFALYAAATDIGATAGQAFSLQWLIAHAAQLPASTLGGAGLCFIIGAMGKSAQVPLHVWLPDAMEAPTTISALIHAATMVNAGVYLMARTLPLFGHLVGWGTILLWVGAITAILAATMALVEPDLKRLLAYSTVSQLGFMMFGLGLGFTGFQAATFHLMSHAIFKALLFLGAGAVIHAAGTRNMYQMGGLAKEMKVTHVTMLLGALSLAGMIGFSGFWSKDMILAAALDSNNYLPLVVVVATAMLTAAYSFRMLNLVFWGESKRDRKAHDAPWEMSVPLVLLAVGALVSWLAIGYLTRAYAAFGIEEVHAFTVVSFVEETFGNVAVLLSLLALGVGFAIFWFRKELGEWSAMKVPLAVVRWGYGFDFIYNGLLIGMRELSVRFRRTHTGDLNVNMVGVAVALAVMAVALFLVGGA
jgi:NADH-quinone oxidoreductase subunit L